MVENVLFAPAAVSGDAGGAFGRQRLCDDPKDGGDEELATGILMGSEPLSVHHDGLDFSAPGPPGTLSAGPFFLLHRI